MSASCSLFRITVPLQSYRCFVSYWVCTMNTYFRCYFCIWLSRDSVSTILCSSCHFLIILHTLRLNSHYSIQIHANTHTHARAHTNMHSQHTCIQQIHSFLIINDFGIKAICRLSMSFGFFFVVVVVLPRIRMKGSVTSFTSIEKIIIFSSDMHQTNI